MKLDKSHYSKFMISVHFERGFVPDTLDAQILQCQDFLNELGKLARKSGRKLHATYSIVSGIQPLHAHFAVSWLPTVGGYLKRSSRHTGNISRFAVIEMLERTFFYVDNPKQAIKRVTHDKKFLTSYVINQPKDEQTTVFSGFYIHSDFVPNASETKMQPYCSKRQFGTFQKVSKKEVYNRFNLILLISVSWFVLISTILLSLF